MFESSAGGFGSRRETAALVAAVAESSQAALGSPASLAVRLKLREEEKKGEKEEEEEKEEKKTGR